MEYLENRVDAEGVHTLVKKLKAILKAETADCAGTLPIPGQLLWQVSSNPGNRAPSSKCDPSQWSTMEMVTGMHSGIPGSKCNLTETPVVVHFHVKLPLRLAGKVTNCMNSLFCGLHSSFTYMCIADHSHWMHLYAGLLLHCQDSIVNESRGSEAKLQQREFDGWDSLMVRRLIEIVSNQTQSNSDSNNPIVESQTVRQVQVDHQGSICA